jgi:prepilin peptidase CpaA
VQVFSMEETTMNWGQFIPPMAVTVAVCAAVIDVGQRRIPNRLTYPAMLSGLVAQGVLHGWKGFLLSAGGGLLFGGVLLLFYLMRSIGAGDVKLAAALGCIVGPSASLQVLFATAVSGGALAIVFMVVSGRVIETLRNTFWVAAFHAQHGLQTHPTVNLDNPGALRMPYGLAFAAGTLYWAAASQLWR